MNDLLELAKNNSLPTGLYYGLVLLINLLSTKTNSKFILKR